MAKRFSSNIMTKAVLFIMAALAIVLILPRDGIYKYEYQKGKPWIYDDLFAPTSFAVLKSDEMLQNEKKTIADAQKFYFNDHQDVMISGEKEMERTFIELWPSIKNTTTKNQAYYLHLMSEIYSSIMKKGVIDHIETLNNKTENHVIVVIRGNRAHNMEYGAFYTKTQADAEVDNRINEKNEFERRYIAPIIKESIHTNILYDKELTDNTLAQQMSNISPTSGAVQAGELIIGRGEIVTDEKERILDSYQKNFATKVSETSDKMWKTLGQAITAILSLLILSLYLYMFKKEVFWDNRKLLLVLTVIILMLFVVTMTVRFGGDEYVYAVPICLAPLLITTFFGARTAVFAHIALLLNTGFIVINGFEFMFIQILAGIITIFSIVKLQKRAQVLKMMVLVFCTYVVATIGFTLIKSGNPFFHDIKMLGYFGISSGLLIISYPLMYLFERVFGLITDVTMMELSDTNNKLLRELATKAPGTFQHANQVANLAEEAAYSIDANAMLARSGAWYHDIGKIENPLYFIENQMEGENPHDELSTEESAKIIVGHVSKGVDIAHKNHLPRQIIDFIQMHHGNRKTGYFYRMAQQTEKPVDDSVFTYPGPIPNSKETALVMMADSVEAASRSLKNPNEQNISQLVENIIDSLVAEHQFENSDITMRNISTVKRLFKKRLMNIYHIRIEYPEEKK